MTREEKNKIYNINYQRVNGKKYRDNYKSIKFEEKRKLIYDTIDVKSYKWKNIETVTGKNKYKISSGGHIVNITKMIILKITKIRLGYLTVTLNGELKMHHRILAEAFIPNQDNKPEVNHKNGIRDDNRLENIEWCTRAENVQHSFKELGRVSNFKNSNHKRTGNKKTKYPKEEIIELLKQKIDYSIIIEKYGVTSKYLTDLVIKNNLERYMQKKK